MKESAKERQKLAWENISYSNRRIDLLLISISGAGIYVCLETIKFLSEKCRDPHWLIWLSGVAFLITIIINFIGQFIGKQSNHYDYLMCEEIIQASEMPTKEEQEAIDKFDKKSEKYDYWANLINIVCTVLMSIGLTALVIYFITFF